MKETGTIILSCTIPTNLGEQLNFIANQEERSKSYYVKKALEIFLEERLENLLLAQIGEKAYKEYLASGKKSTDFDEIRKRLKLNTTTKSNLKKNAVENKVLSKSRKGISKTRKSSTKKN